MLVMKFGGTSVGSGERILRVAEIVLTHRERAPVVMTSALTGITDALLALATAATQGDRALCDQRLVAISQRHREAAHVIDAQAEWSSMHQLLAELREVTTGAMDDQDRSGIQRDHLASFGERLAVTLVAGALQRLGASPLAWTAPLIATDDHFGEATPHAKRTQEVVQAALAQAGTQILVAPGFIGMSPANQITTLGRGGSDYSATLLAAALGAEACWIYTDVDGVFTADPRIVPGAQVLPAVSFATAGRLAMCGAKVLHPRSVAPAARHGFELRVRNTFKPTHEGTILMATPDATRGLPQAIAGRRHLCALTLAGRGLAEIPNLFGRLCQAVHDAGAEIVLAAHPAPGHDPQLIIEESQAEAVSQHIIVAFAQERAQSQIGEILLRHDLAQCTIVGDELGSVAIVQAQYALAAEKIALITQSATPEALTFIIPLAALERAMRRLHQDVIEPALREANERRKQPYANGQWAAGGRQQQRRRVNTPQH